MMTVARLDARQERRIMVKSTIAIGLMFAFATTVQSVLALGVFSRNIRSLESSPLAEIVVRGGINTATVAVVLLGVLLLSPETRSIVGRVVVTVAIAVAGGGARALLQWVTGLYRTDDLPVLFTEISTTTAAATVTLLIGYALVASWRRLREEERRRSQSELQVLAAYRELRGEELRVRREVAQEIHGTVQAAFVVIEAEADDIATQVSPALAARLGSLVELVHDVRENQLRSLTRRLYPADFERGIHPALFALVARLPPYISVDDRFSEGARSLDADSSVSVDARLLLVRVVEEGLTNAVRHGRARSVRIELTVERGRTVVVRIADDGVGPARDAEWSGLDRLRRSLGLIDGSLTLTGGGASGGAVLTAVLSLSDDG
jgi:signal transduction histidine kinase